MYMVLSPDSLRTRDLDPLAMLLGLVLTAGCSGAVAHGHPSHTVLPEDSLSTTDPSPRVQSTQICKIWSTKGSSIRNRNLDLGYMPHMRVLGPRGRV